MSVFITGMVFLAICAGPRTAPADQAVSYRNITLYPIGSGLSNRSADVITLDEGIKAGTVKITETGNTPGLVRPRPVRNGFVGSGTRGQGRPTQDFQQNASSAQVNTLWLTNNSGKTLLLIAGEMLLGGQQDRIVQKDGLIPPTKQPIDLAVFCVEHGRWTAQSAEFGNFGKGVGGFAAPGGGRAAAVVTQDQSAVWSKVAGQLRSLGTDNATGTYRENYTNPKTVGSIAEFVAAINARFPVLQAAGVVVAINGKLVWMDRFDSRATFAKYWRKLLKSYALEALADPGKPVSSPPYSAALQFAESRSGKASFEGQEGLSKLTKVESATTVLYELEDLQSSPPILVHANKVLKQ